MGQRKRKYIKIIISYTISLIWVFLCYTNLVSAIKPRWLIIVLLFVLFILLGAMLGGLEHEFVSKRKRLVFLLVYLPVAFLFIGIILFVINNYTSVGTLYGGRWVYY